MGGGQCLHHADLFRVSHREFGFYCILREFAEGFHQGMTQSGLLFFKDFPRWGKDRSMKYSYLLTNI